MKRSRFSAEQTIGILGEAEVGSPKKAVSRAKAGVLGRLIRRMSSETSETAPTACAKASWTPGVASTSRTAIFKRSGRLPAFLGRAQILHMVSHAEASVDSAEKP